jgi:hypothetical protein
MSREKSKFQLLFSLFLILAGATARLLPHPPNFTPLAAIALFGGKQLPKRLSLIIPLLALFLSDLIIGLYSWKIMLAVYTGFIISALLGWLMRKKFSPARLAGLTLASSTTFFLLTNAAVWAFSPIYPNTFQGLMLSYWYGLPFFRNELMGNLFYVTLIFGCFEIVKIISAQLRRQPISK